MKITAETLLKFFTSHFNLLVCVLLVVLGGLTTAVVANTIKLSEQGTILNSHVGVNGERLHLTDEQLKIILKEFSDLKQGQKSLAEKINGN